MNEEELKAMIEKLFADMSTKIDSITGSVDEKISAMSDRIIALEKQNTVVAENKATDEEKQKKEQEEKEQKQKEENEKALATNADIKSRANNVVVNVSGGSTDGEEQAKIEKVKSYFGNTYKKHTA